MQRLILIHWNKSTGPELIIQYPPEKQYPSKELLLKIWAIHELDKESTIIEYIPEMPKNEQYISNLQEFEREIYYIIIEYLQNDKIEKVIKDYPDILATVSKNLIEFANTDKMPRAISEAFYTFENFTQFKKEAILLSFFVDKMKNIILNILRNGAISKSELNLILRKDYGFSTLNLDLQLTSFMRENIIIKKLIPGSLECYFLIKDIDCIRIPPNKIPSYDDKSILDDYKKNLTDLYYNYDCTSEIEHKSLVNFLNDKNCFQLLEKLREKNITVSESLEILNNNEELFNELLKKKFIFEAKGVISLLSDIKFIKFTPYYIINNLSKRYKEQIISFDQYITHLKLLFEQSSKANSLFNYEIM